MAQELQTNIGTEGCVSAPHQGPRAEASRRPVDRKRLVLGALAALGVAAGMLTTLPVGSAATYPGGEKAQECNSFDNVCYVK